MAVEEGWQYTLGSGQQTVGNRQWAVDRKTVDIKQWAVNSGHGTVGSKVAVGNGWLTVNSGQ